LKILVLGATGRTGRLVVEQALAAEHTVTAFARDPSKLKLRNDRLTIVNGDAHNVDDLSAALKGQDAVINTIGGGERKLITSTTEALVEAMQKSGVKRVVAMSTFIATPNFMPSGVMRLFPRLVRGMAADDVAAVKILDDRLCHPAQEQAQGRLPPRRPGRARDGQEHDQSGRRGRLFARGS
jgi:nucleoside-diphosphate-sugar epimerase